MARTDKSWRARVGFETHEWRVLQTSPLGPLWVPPPSFFSITKSRQQCQGRGGKRREGKSFKPLRNFFDALQLFAPALKRTAFSRRNIHFFTGARVAPRSPSCAASRWKTPKAAAAQYGLTAPKRILQ